MKQSINKCMHSVWWQRIIAVVLALSMVLIPIQFPGIANATEEKQSDTWYHDDFDFTTPTTEDDSDDGNSGAVNSSYKWGTKVSTDKSVTANENSLSFVNGGASSNMYYSIAHLTNEDGSMAFADLANYSVEATGKFLAGTPGDANAADNTATTNQTRLGVMGRIQIDNNLLSYYYAYIRYDNQKVYLVKAVADLANAKQQLSSDANFYSETYQYGTAQWLIQSGNLVSKIAADEEHTIKMTFEDNKIKVFLDDAASPSIETDYCDTSAKLTAGGVGVSLTRSGCAVVSSFKVTDADGDIIYDMVNPSGSNGNDDAPAYNWDTATKVSADTHTNAVTFEDGIFLFDNDETITDSNGYYSMAYLANSDGSVALSDKSNYSVEATARFLAETNAAQQGNHNQTRLGVMGRFQRNADGTMSYYYAYIRFANKTVNLYKGTVNAVGSQTLTMIADPVNAFTSNTVVDTDYALKLTFEDSKIKVYVNGEEKISADYDAAPLTTGGVGVNLTRGGNAQLTNFKVTDASGAVLYSSVPSAGDGEGDGSGGGDGDDTVQTVSKDIVYKWNEMISKQLDGDGNPAIGGTTLAISDGKLALSNGPCAYKNNNLYHFIHLTAADGQTDYAERWTDYAVEMKGRFVTDADIPLQDQTRLGLMGRVQVADDGSMTYYYACIRYSKKNVYLYKVTLNAAGNTQTFVTTLKDFSMAAAFAADKDYTLGMDFRGSTITVTLDGAALFSVEDTSYTAGGIGVQLTRQGCAEVDYVKITHRDATKGFADNFTDSRFFTGVTHKWNEKVTSAVNGSGVAQMGETIFDIEGGKLTIGNTTTYGNDHLYHIGYLSASDGATDYASLWTDYTVEMKGKFVATDARPLTTQTKLGLMGRVTVDTAGVITGYLAYIRQGQKDLYLKKFTISADGKTQTWEALGSKNVVTTAFAPDTEYTLKMVFDGSSIKVYLDDVEQLSATDASCPAGSVGVQLTRAGTIEVDYIKVFPNGADSGVGFAEYPFNADLAILGNQFNFTASASGTFAVENTQLTYMDSTAGAFGLAALKPKAKAMLLDSAIIAEGSAAADGGFAVLGRFDAVNKNYYKLTMLQGSGMQLIRCSAGTETVVATIDRNALWQEFGVMLNSDTVCELKLQVYTDKVEGFIDGICVLSWTDPAPLAAGVGATQLLSGTKLDKLEIAPADAVKSMTVMKDTNFNGKASDLKDHLVAFTDVIEVPAGHTPDLKHLYLMVEMYDGSTRIVPVDMAEVGEFAVASLGEKTVTVTYLRSAVEIPYKVIDRSEMVAQLNADLTAFDGSTLIKDDKAAVYALSDRFDLLTAAEKEAISAENKAKLIDAVETIEELLYPVLAGTEVVFRDTYDAATDFDKYSKESEDTHMRYEGYWSVDNGTLVQYFGNDADRTQSCIFGAVVKDEYWNLKSVSADVQIIDRGVWCGLLIPFGNGGDYFRFNICDKVSAGNYVSRITMVKNEETLGAVMITDPEKAFQPGVWYNLRVIFHEGYIYAYVDDELIFEVEDKITPVIDEPITAGTVGYFNAEGTGRFDNLTVRGTVAEAPEKDKVPETAPGSYEDTFDDETVGKDPSHWLESNTENEWIVADKGGNKVYASTGNTEGKAHTYLHVFETDVDYSVKITVTTAGNYPVFGLTARDNYADSYIKAGYDFQLQKWFIKARLATDWQEIATYADAAAPLTVGQTVTLRLKVVGEEMQLFIDGAETPVVTMQYADKVMPGKVGVFTERCDVEFDDVKLELLSGQGRVNDGITESYTSGQYGSTLILPTYDGDGPGDDLMVYSYGVREISSDNGKTFHLSTEYGSQSIGCAIRLHDGSYLNLHSSIAYRSEDAKTWTKIGQMPYYGINEGDYVTGLQIITELEIEEGKYRLFYTPLRYIKADVGGFYRESMVEIYYSDDGGYTWQQSETDLASIVNLRHTAESNIIKNADGDLIIYTTHNSSQTIRYSVSHDGGITWEGDYTIPYILDGSGTSFCVQEDPYEPGTFYMACVYNKSCRAHQGMPRLRLVLLRSYDGMNWEFLCDLDRWGVISEGPRNEIMQNINMYLATSPDSVYVRFSRAEAWWTNDSHNIRYGRLVRIEKDKMDAYDVWPLQYELSDKEITYIEGVEENILLNTDLSDLKFNVYYYRADGNVKDQIPMDQAIVSGLDTSVPGEQTVTVDYKHFRAVYTVNVVAGDAPAISGVEDGKTYCGAQEVTVSDANGDQLSVTLNGQAVALAEGKFTVSAAEGEQTIVATDKAGNVTTVKITVNEGHKGGTATCEKQAECEVCGEAYGELAAHKGGTATCTDKAECEVCGEAYGEKNADNHTKDAKWTITADKHTKAYECCGAVVVAEAAHTGGEATCEHKAKCEVCNAEYGKLADHKGGTATCTDKAKCEVCGEAYGEKNADNHTKDAKWTITADKHAKAYECCGKVVVAEEAHEWKDGKCQECGYEAEVGTEQKPIEIPADKETVKEEAEVEAGEEKHFEVAEDMGGKVITVKGEGAYVIVEGKKYEAVNGIVEVKLPEKTGKINVVIGNAGTKAGAFSITIAQPSEDNSDTGDNAALVLFGSLLMLSVLAAGVLLVPDIRKKYFH